jgi:hypothetical protein
MGFVIVEWIDDNRNVPVFAGPFGTRQEADEEAKRHKPQHGGFICVEREQLQKRPVAKRRGGKKLPRLREGLRRNRR